MKSTRHFLLALFAIMLAAATSFAQVGPGPDLGTFPGNPGAGTTNSRIITNAFTGANTGSGSGGIFNSPTINNGTLNSPTINNQTIGGGVAASSSGYNAFTISSPVCTTTGAGGACAEPTHTFSPVGFADTSYFINCTITSIGTNVPAIESVTKASNAVVVNIIGVTAPSASAATIDCVAIHQ